MLPCAHDGWNMDVFDTGLDCDVHIPKQSEPNVLPNPAPIEHPHVILQNMCFDIKGICIQQCTATIDHSETQKCSISTTIEQLQISSELKKRIEYTRQRMDTHVYYRFEKKTTARSDLSGRNKSMAEHFISSTPESEIIAIKTYIEHCALSGRSIDMFLTSAMSLNDIHYHLNINRHPYEISTSTQGHRFYISVSYHTTLKHYTKTYFDPFARGVSISYKLSDGTEMDIPLCQFIFFKWARQHAVIEFIENMVKNDDSTIRFTTPSVRNILKKVQNNNVRTVTLYPVTRLASIYTSTL
jgi:hypothetical protein